MYYGGTSKAESRSLKASLTSLVQILLLVSTLASFVSWLAGMACEAADIAHWLWPVKSTRNLYSTLRIDREALVRGWPLGPA